MRSRTRKSKVLKLDDKAFSPTVGVNKKLDKFSCSEITEYIFVKTKHPRYGYVIHQEMVSNYGINGKLNLLNDNKFDTESYDNKAYGHTFWY